MRILILVMLLTVKFIASPVYANKTHVADMLDKGQSKITLGFLFTSVNIDSEYIFSPSLNKMTGEFTGKSSEYTFGFLLGATDNLDIGFSIPYSYSSTFEGDLKDSSNTLSYYSKTEGSKDFSFGAKYLLSGKNQKDKLLVIAFVQIPTAGDKTAQSEIKLNGTLTQQGETGEPGDGMDVWGVGTILSLSTDWGQSFFSLGYTLRGDKTEEGEQVDPGNILSLSGGAEYLLSDRTTMTGTIFFGLIGEGKGAGYISKSYNSNGFSFTLTHDLNRQMSLEFGLQLLYAQNTETEFTSSGDRLLDDYRQLTTGFALYYFFN